MRGKNDREEDRERARVLEGEGVRDIPHGSGGFFLGVGGRMERWSNPCLKPSGSHCGSVTGLSAIAAA